MSKSTRRPLLAGEPGRAMHWPPPAQSRCSTRRTGGVRYCGLARDNTRNARRRGCEHTGAAPRVDALVGVSRWMTRAAPGHLPDSVPVNTERAIHVGAQAFREDEPNISPGASTSTPRVALLVLLLSADVGIDDADAHQGLRRCAHAGTCRGDGLTLRELAATGSADTPHCPETSAAPASSNLCHPCRAHAAQLHRGTRPRFMPATDPC